MKNNYSPVEVRQLMDPWAELATELDVAIVFVNHFNKSGGSARARNSGAHSLEDEARIVHIVTDDKDERDTFLFIQSKGNLLPKPLPGLRYMMENTPTEVKGISNNVPKLVWLGVSEITRADDALAQAVASKGDKAKAWLKDFLKRNGKPEPTLPGDFNWVEETIEKEGMVAGHSRWIIRQAKEQLRRSMPKAMM